MTTCTERKYLLSGGMHEYTCELMQYDRDFGILRYVIDRAYTVGGVLLAPGDITYALYWSERPYTLYTWRRPRMQQVLCYFNIADRISLQPEVFSWRDLVIDILIDGRGDAHVLDEEELPQDIDPRLLAHILDAKAGILRDCRAIVAEAGGLLKNLAPSPAS